MEQSLTIPFICTVLSFRQLIINCKTSQIATAISTQSRHMYPKHKLKMFDPYRGNAKLIPSSSAPPEQANRIPTHGTGPYVFDYV
jgi:hypothetical protein